MDFNVQIQGADQLIAALKNAPTIAAPILSRTLSASQAILVKYTAKGIVPWRTGFLAQTFQAQLSDNMLRWFPTASYAPLVEFGTKPHVILPKTAKALFWPGAAHPVARVNHPGTKPNAFMERIVAAAQPDINAMFGTALQQIVTAIAAQA